MRWVWVGAALVGALAAESPARAQWIGPPPFGGGFFNSGVGFNYTGRHLRVGGFFGSSAYGYGGFSPFGYGYGYGGPFPFGVRSRVTVINTVAAPAVVSPIVVNIGQVNINNPPPNGVQPPFSDEEDLPPQIDPRDFVIIRPRNGRPRPPEAVPAPQPDRPPPKPAPKEPPPRPVPQPKVDLGKGTPLPLQPPPEANPRDEAARQVGLGRQAFAAGEYGRALERFRRAAEVRPADPLPHFLAAQALFAMGKYREAVASIAAGVKLAPDWPASRFRPRDLYGPNAEAYNNHLRELRDALAARPDDPALLFLLGYQMWFDGQRDQARLLFERAAKRARDPAPIEPFLKDEGGPVVREAR